MAQTLRLQARPSFGGSIRGLASLVAGLAVGLLLAGAIVTVLATQLFGYHVLTVSSGSMEPALAKGDVIVTRPVAGSSIHQGDIIVYRQTKDAFVIHRVAAIHTFVLNLTDSKTGETDTATTYEFVTRGDANAAADIAPVPDRAVQGELWFELPGLPGDLAGLRLQWLFLVVAVGLAGAWIAWELRHRLTRRAAPPSEKA